MKQLSRKKIQDMIDLNGANTSSRRSSGGSGAGGGGGVSSAWVDEHYVSKDFFARLFTIHSDVVTQEDPHGEVVEPNDLETDIDNIELMFGSWTEHYLSVLGQGSGGGGGGSILTEPLASINEAGLGTPSGSNKVIAWNGSGWEYKTFGSGSGTVTSIGVGTGLSSSTGGAITTSGTLSISSDYQTKISHGETAYGWGNHANAGYLTASSTVITTLQSYFDASGHAKSALKLTTVSKTAWGQTYWTANGVPDTISGKLSDVGDIEMGNGNKIKWKNSSSTLLSFITLSSSNEFVLGESTAAQGYTTYLRGREIIFQSGYTNGSAVNNASLDTNGLFAVKKLKIGSIVISEDSINGGLHIESAGIYADTYISALGAGSGGGSGSGITMADVWSALATPAPSSSQQQIEASHITAALSTCVRTTGNQTITGNKTLYNTIVTSNFGAKFESICIACDTTGFVGTHSGEINRFSGTLHLQHDTAQPISMCQNTLVFSMTTVNTVTVGAMGTNSNRGLYFYTSGNAPIWGSQAWSNISDIRRKDIVTLVNGNVEDIANAPVFDFTWKGDTSLRVMLGTSAQYWQNIFPHAITDFGGTLTMDYGSTALAAAVITARKVLTHEEQIAALNRRIGELESEIKQLKAA